MHGPHGTRWICVKFGHTVLNSSWLFLFMLPLTKFASKEPEKETVSGSNSDPVAAICADAAEPFDSVFAKYPVPKNRILWLCKNVLGPRSLHRWYGLHELLGQKYQDLSWKECNALEAHLRRLGSDYLFKLFSVNVSPSPPLNIAIGRYRGRGQSACTRILLCILSGIENNRDTYVTATCLLDADYAVDTGASNFLRRFDRLSSGYLRTIENKQDCLNKLFAWTWFAEAFASVGISGLSNYHGTIRAIDLQFSTYYDC